MKVEIEGRFSLNLARVEALVQLYDELVDHGGRQPVKTADLLRASVVFLHASLEDVVRSALEWKLPSAAAEHLEDIPLIGHKNRTKYTLKDLASHRGKSVDVVLAESVSASLLESNFNDPGEIERALEQIGVQKAILDPFRGYLGPMMKRRHWIVHRADRNDMTGQGQHAARSLSPATVTTWRKAVTGFGTALIGAL